MPSDFTPSRLMAPPDGLTGALIALEGVRDGAVILHGPTGCRGYHAALSEFWFPRDVHHEPLNFAERFYFGQTRIPTTYLDQDDFVFGGSAKLRDAVATVVKRAPGMIAVVDAPGAALIGDDLEACTSGETDGIPSVVIEMPASGRSMADGFSQALVTMLAKVAKEPQSVQPRTVALLGLSIAHAHWEGSIAEIRRLLSLCGIEVVCVPGAGSSVGEMRRLPGAACAAVLHSEYGHAAADWLGQRFHTPVVELDCGAPIGFDATEDWIRAVADMVGADPNPALNDIHHCRQRVARQLYRFDLFQDTLRGARVSIQSDPSIALPLTRWLYEYLGLIPVSVEVERGQSEAIASKLKSYLASISCEDAWARCWDGVASDLLFADGPTTGIAKTRGRGAGCIELLQPSDDFINIVPKAMLGAAGAMYLVEQVVNGVAER